MTDCFIYDAVRTPRGKGRKKDGALADAPPLQMAKAVLRALPDRSEFDSAEIEDVIFGCVEPVGEQGANVGRMAALISGYDDSVPGVQLNRFCSSGLEAVNIAAAKVKAGDVDLIVGGGMESMSRISMGAAGGAWSTDPELAWGTSFVPQGIGADLIATKHGYSRRDVDSFAVESQRRAAAAWDGDRFGKSVVPVKDCVGVTMLERDEHMRPGTTLEDLSQLKPSFETMGRNFGFDAVAIQKHPDVEQIHHVHHAGNSSGIVDGAAAVLIGSKGAGERLGLKPRARIVRSATVGSEPCIMLTGPMPASRKALDKAGMKTSDIDLWEINEAFSAVCLLFMEQMGIDHSVTNVNGGAIAFGHPLGATGAMLLGTMVDELERRDLGTALITLCVGAGMGTSTIIERV
ncbi:MAG: acetyl-CoA C-acetyltransferase [Deltaproteobacteria bacterium]|nr:acetyl-CoA C-acetyltransferase [Deltaproteobacteria bacterium]NND29685.1 acetyl-CoA C-acetyltransferase [Myxococcales bacterium]MBT8466060.1 acetyl-CoA C-acetyltransferase [Deltaproteobacteria bacterium]MBT8483620.1 acetyl-CoA C-acetyltransferase [Deltaproteobacteria bacterium]NNK09319.1 acetyl-CoA C-acetyltransferase [Myxococcales bacterium]